MECEPNYNFDIFQLVRQFEDMIQSGIDIYLDEKSLQRLMDYYADEHEYANAGKVAFEAIRHFPYNLNFRVANNLFPAWIFDVNNSEIRFRSDTTNQDIYLTISQSEVWGFREKMDFNMYKSKQILIPEN